MGNFQQELSKLLNIYSKESVSNTPDYILAQYLGDCLEAYNKAQVSKDIYSGIQVLPYDKV